MAAAVAMALGWTAARAVVRRPIWWFQMLRPSVLQPEQLPFRTYSTEASKDAPQKPNALDRESRFKERPWDYLQSEEYIEKYGSNPVWFSYRRNHKGQIPPQKTRKTCIRGTKVCGNACPICRDHNLFLDYRNVKLLEQFICPHSGVVYHPTHTGICMKRYKQLSSAIQQAQENGLLSVTIPFTSFKGQDYSNQHPAVKKTPPSPTLQSSSSWYEWYDWHQPAEKDIKLIKRIYKNFLKEESGPP